MYLAHAQLCSTFRQGDRTFGTDTAAGVLQYWVRRKVHCSSCVGSSISFGCLGTLLPVFFTTHLGTRFRFDTVWVVFKSIWSQQRQGAAPCLGCALLWPLPQVPSPTSMCPSLSWLSLRKPDVVEKLGVLPDVDRQVRDPGHAEVGAFWVSSGAPRWATVLNLRTGFFRMTCRGTLKSCFFFVEGGATVTGHSM